MLKLFEWPLVRIAFVPFHVIAYLIVRSERERAKYLLLPPPLNARKKIHVVIDIRNDMYRCIYMWEY